jgi:hypothetical protein
LIAQKKKRLAMDSSSDLYRHLRRYKLDSLLLSIGNITRQMMVNNQAIQPIDIIREKGAFQRKNKFILSAFHLSDLAYHAIQATNDFGNKQPSFYDIINLCNEYIKYDEYRSDVEYKELQTSDFLIKLGIGLSQKQFIYQEIYRIREEFNRQVEIIQEIPKKINSKLCLDEISYQNKDLGVSLSELRAILFALYAYNSDASDFTAITLNKSITHIHPAFTTANINRVIQFYSANYKDYRQSKLAGNHFHIKPIVRTSNNRFIVPDSYMLAKKMADGPLWVIRDHFRDNNSQSFVNHFGELFEQYVEDMLKSQLNINQYHRIPESNKRKRKDQRADWFIYTKKYRIIIELKSAIAGMLIKQLYPDINNIKKYTKERLSEGILQLDKTEYDYPDSHRKTIKILVHYDTLYISDGALRPLAVEQQKNRLINTNNIFFCDIGEFEWFISVMNHSEAEAELILDKKIETQDDPKEGIEFSQIIPRISKIGNTYNNQVLDHWGKHLPGLQRPFSQLYPS